MSDISFVVSVKLSAVLRMSPTTTLNRNDVVKELKEYGIDNMIDNMIDSIELVGVITDHGSIAIDLDGNRGD
jgi:hypothetical protein